MIDIKNVKSAFKIVDKISIEFPYENAEIATRLITVLETATYI